MAVIPDMAGSMESSPPPCIEGQEEVGRGMGATENAQLTDGLTSGPSHWEKGGSQGPEEG